jgi:hypothetical protein
VGVDGRNRVMLSPFRSKTGRNRPSNSEFIFGSSAWLRGLIKPSSGYAIAYIDYEQQEFGIAAKLSGDANMCWKPTRPGILIWHLRKAPVLFVNTPPKKATARSETSTSSVLTFSSIISIT